MSQEPATDVELVNAHTEKKPEIKILIYTDDPERVRESGPFGIRELRKHLAIQGPAFATIKITLVSRNSDAQHHANHRLNKELMKDNYDQIWFFGIHQTNKDPYKLDFPGGGGPYSELGEAEVDDLRLRMSMSKHRLAIGIGVLVAGDHSNPSPKIPLPPSPTTLCPPNVDHRTFLGLGRALGKHIPRAGELRNWEGPPTHCAEDSFNTQFLPSGGDLADPSNQADQYPQPLILETFDLQGNPSRLGQPHKLFMGKNGKWIRVLPDHDHEGAVKLPKSFPLSIWPSGHFFQPKPHVIAYGTDRRTGRRLKILAAYDGNPAGVGRIVSDSSWHHYFNINLDGLSADLPQSPEAKQIGQFYSNLAVWLSPLKKRREMGIAMVLWLAKHPLMLEQLGSGALNLGRLASGLALKVASRCEVEELLIALCPHRLRQRVENLVFPLPNELNSLPSIEILLGSILNEYFLVKSRQDKEVHTSSVDLSTILQNGFESACLMNAAAVVPIAYESLERLLLLRGQSISPQVEIALEILKSLDIDELSKRGVV